MNRGYINKGKHISMIDYYKWRWLMITSLLDDRFMMINIDDKLNFILFIDDRFMINDQCLIHNGG